MDEHGADESREERDRRHDIEAAVREVVDSLIATVRREGVHLDEANALEAVTLVYNAVQPSLAALPAEWEYGLADGAGMLFGPADEATVRARQEQIIVPLRLMRRRAATAWEAVREPDDAVPSVKIESCRAPESSSETCACGPACRYPDQRSSDDVAKESEG